MMLQDDYSFNIWCSVAGFDSADKFATYGLDVNIYSLYKASLDVNKSVSYTFLNTVTNISLTLTSNSNFWYYYGYTISGVDYSFAVNGGAVASNVFGIASTKRWVIVCSLLSNSFTIPIGAEWVYIGKNISHIEGGSWLRYIHSSSFITIKTIGSFVGAVALTGDFYVPTGVVSIPDNNFQFNYELTSINIPNTIITIGNGNFAGCTGISSFNIPASVISIGLERFLEGCSKLVTINVDANNPNYSSTATILYNKTKTILYYGCAGVTDFIVPNGVVTIADYAFYRSTKIVNITIPSTVANLGGRTFGFNSTLRTINSYSLTPPTAYTLTFSGVNTSLCTIHIPSSVDVATYRANIYWNAFINIINDL